MRKILLGLALATTISSIQAAEISRTINFTSDYRSRGQSQTSGDPTVQDRIDSFFENGVFASIWGSNVRVMMPAWKQTFPQAIAAPSMTTWATVQDCYYTYPSYESYDSDYTEVLRNLYYGDFILTYGNTNEDFNTDLTDQYMAVDSSTRITRDINHNLDACNSFDNYQDSIYSDSYQRFHNLSVREHRRFRSYCKLLG